MTVDQRQHAQFLENHCPKYVWAAIVCSDHDDKTLLDIELKPFFGTVIRRDLGGQTYKNTKLPVSEQVQTPLLLLGSNVMTDVLSTGEVFFK